MNFDKLNWLRWGIFGGILGGLIAIVGFLILSPPTDSVVLFVLLRVAVGSVVATIMGPILVPRLTKNKSRMLYFVLAILIGVLLFVYAGIDDSPGGQMIGLLVVIIGIVGVIRRKKKKESS